MTLKIQCVRQASQSADVTVCPGQNGDVQIEKDEWFNSVTSAVAQPERKPQRAAGGFVGLS